MHRRFLLAAIASASLALAACSTPQAVTERAPPPSLAEAPPIVFVHGNGDSAAFWQTTLWRFESNGWPRERLFAFDVPYPLARDEDSQDQPGRTSSAQHMAHLKAAVDKALQATGARQVVLMGNSRGGYAIRNYIDSGGAPTVSHAILGGTPNHGAWAVPGLREGSEFSGTGPLLQRLNAPKNPAGDEVAGPVQWLTIRSDNNDKYAQPDGKWVGMVGKPTNVTHAGPELKGATNVVLPGIDHRETSSSPQAFAAAYRFITGKAPRTEGIEPEATVRIGGKVTGLGLVPTDPRSGSFASNLPLPGAQLQVYATHPATGERTGDALLRTAIGSDGAWGPLKVQPGMPLEFVVSAPGYATTHIYRSGFVRGSDIVHLRAERMAQPVTVPVSLVTLARPRGYLDPARDRMRIGGVPVQGVPAGAGVALTTTRVNDDLGTIAVEFNGETVTGRTWPASDGHLVTLEITQ